MAPLAIALVIGGLATELLYVVLRVAGAGGWLAGGAALVAGALGAELLRRRVRDVSWSRPSLAVFVVLGALAVVQTARAAAFALQPREPRYSLLPQDEFLLHHNCFTAYYEGAIFTGQSPNIYDPRLYRAPPGAPPESKPPWQNPKDGRRTIEGLFFVDTYEYPPPFLLAPRAAQVLGASFLEARALWFALQAASLIAALLLLGAQLGARFAVVAPLVYLAPATQMTLQMGNFQVGAIAGCLIAMVLIARRHELAGAALLSFVILAKLFPGVLVLVLAVQRRWRALVLVLVTGAAWLGLTNVLLGHDPLHAFFAFHLPRLASGEAFPHLRQPFVAAINHSPYGMPLKLGMSFGVASVVGWIYTAVPVAAAILLGRRRDAGPLVWALVLALGTYRAPFLPQEYAAIGPVVVLAVLGATRRSVALFVAAWIAVVVWAPWSLIEDARVAAYLTLVPQVAAIGVFVWAIGAASAPAPAPPPAAPRSVAPEPPPRAAA